MHVLNFIYFSFLLYSFYRGVRGDIRLLDSINWVKQESKKVLSSTRQISSKLYILIPVLREQQIIKETFDHFTHLTGNYNLVFITSEKEVFEEERNKAKLEGLLPEVIRITNVTEFQEKLLGIFTMSEALEVYKEITNLSSEFEKSVRVLEKFKSRKSTMQILEDLISSNPESEAHTSIIHYPFIEGVMAHQLNFACRQLESQMDIENTYIAVYNADSKVSYNLIEIISNYLSSNPKARVIQQSALYFANFNTFFGKYRKWFLQSIAFLQSRWTLAHELPRIRFQTTKIGSDLEGAHVVGHGLCIRLDALKKVGYFPTSFTNEDLPLGYILRLYGYQIYPLPVLENAESPTTVKQVFNQYTTWFYGVLSYPYYLKYVLEHEELPKIKALMWALKYIVRGLLWLVLSLIWLYLFVYPIIALNATMLVLSGISFFVYAPLNFILLTNLVNRHWESIFQSRPTETVTINPGTLIMSVPAYLTHSYPPFVAVYNVIKANLNKTGVQKRKTER